MFLIVFLISQNKLFFPYYLLTCQKYFTSLKSQFSSLILKPQILGRKSQVSRRKLEVSRCSWRSKHKRKMEGSRKECLENTSSRARPWAIKSILHHDQFLTCSNMCMSAPSSWVYGSCARFWATIAPLRLVLRNRTGWEIPNRGQTQTFFDFLWQYMSQREIQIKQTSCDKPGLFICIKHRILVYRAVR